MSWAPWKTLNDWAPFKIDALGLVTLLGAEEVNSAVGRLVSSAYLEYLPLLGAFIIAGDRFTEKAAGFNLYNISQGIHTTDLSAWLTRWMLSQDFEVTRSFVVWKVTPPRSRKKEIVASVVISFVLNGFLIAMTLLSADWYGFANALAMVISIVVRAYVIGQQRLAIDAMVDKAVAKTEPPEGTYEADRANYKAWKLEKKAEVRHRNVKTRPVENMSMQTNSSADAADDPKQVALESGRKAKQPTRPNPKEHRTEAWTGKDTKVLIIQTDSKAVTFWMPKELLGPPSVFIEGPMLLHPKPYFAFRAIGWLVFAVHIVAIGMADLASQMYTVALLVLPTVALVFKAGCDDSRWPSTVQDWKTHLFHRSSSGGGSSSDEYHSPSPQVDESVSQTQFTKVRECWIGSRLKAEIYEWPASYEFRQETQAGAGAGVGGATEEERWVSGVPLKGSSARSKKRQDLYAWLALDKDEEESMDKWDLFPHIREGNTSWWKTYKLKKWTLRRNESFGPQMVPEDPAEEQSGTAGVAAGQKAYQRPGRTDTLNFIPEPAAISEGAAHGQPLPSRSSVVQVGSSAYPAISDHEQAKVESIERADNLPVAGATSGSGSGPRPAPPPLNTALGTDGTATIVPEVVLTSSPTTSTKE